MTSKASAEKLFCRLCWVLLVWSPLLALADPCPLCWESSPFPDPDLEIPSGAVQYFVGNYLDEYLVGGTIGCQEVVELIVNVTVSLYGEVDSESYECDVANSFGGICGCEPIENSCELCRNGLANELPSLYAYSRQDCMLIDFSVTQYANESESCAFMQEVWPECCSDFDDWVSFLFHNGAADTKTKQTALVWVPRVTGFLSLLGSLTIIIDVVRSKESGKSVYHSLVLALSFFDIISSTCWILSTASVDKDSAPWIPWAVGNERTCKAQGFFYQLGYIGSISYNLVLSVYYLLIIVYSKRENQMKKIRLWLHAPPGIVALAMACAGIPFYVSISYFCTIAPPPMTVDWVLTIIFSILPICLVFTASAIIMCVIYCSVRQKTRASVKWSIRNLAQARGSHGDQSSVRGTTLTPAQKMERAVFWQALFYVCAFFVSWPVYVVGQLSGESQSYCLWIAIAILAPLQGFMNSLVYFRPRFVQYRARKKRERDARRRLEKEEGQTGTTGSPERTCDAELADPLPMGQAQADPVWQLEYYRSEAEASVGVNEDAEGTGHSSTLHSKVTRTTLSQN